MYLVLLNRIQMVHMINTMSCVFYHNKHTHNHMGNYIKMPMKALSGCIKWKKTPDNTLLKRVTLYFEKTAILREN